MKNLNKLISFIMIGSSNAYSVIDLSQFNPPSSTIGGISLPRTENEFHIKSSIKSDDLEYFLKSTFDANQTDTFYSEMIKDVNSKLKGKRVSNDTYKYMRDTSLLDDIKSKQDSYNSIQDAVDIVTSHLSSLDLNQFKNSFLLGDEKEKKNFFIDLTQNPQQKSKYDYYSTKIATENDLFDLSYLKNETISSNNVFTALNTITIVERKSIDIRRKNGSIRYSLYPITINGNKNIVVVDGKGNNCVDRIAPLDFNSCDSPLGKKPEIMNILLPCNSNSICGLDNSFWNQIPKTSNRKMSKDDIKTIKRFTDHLTNKSLLIDSPLDKIPGGHFPSSLNSVDPAMSEIINIAKKDVDYHGLIAKSIYTKPSETSSLSFTYELNDDNCTKAARDGEECLSLNESIYLFIPQKFQNMPISDLTIAHRQNKKDNRGTDSFNSSTGVKVKDKYPAFISAQVYNPQYPYKYAWRYWGSHTSGLNGGKYSEHKKNGSWEFDNLYEWPLHGHKASHQNDSKIVTPLTGKYIRIFADHGKYSKIIDHDKAYVHSVTVTFVPTNSDHYKEWSFTNKRTKFGDPQTMQGREYGGGPKFNGKYPGAIVLSKYSRPKNISKLNEKYWDSYLNSLEYKLEAGKKLQIVEIAAGDTKPDGKPNKDGGVGSLGGAKLEVVYVRADGEEEIIDGANLGPKGVITGFPKDNGITIQKGDYLRIKAYGGKAYIMGMRVGYND